MPMNCSRLCVNEQFHVQYLSICVVTPIELIAVTLKTQFKVVGWWGDFSYRLPSISLLPYCSSPPPPVEQLLQIHCSEIQMYISDLEAKA
ncbi:hypothetical protein MUK42_36518 [Musa troglodytarum]|uniref:Uncharacterized protein n=1 Tax=Musa troglodytarum TaxID=320322 RepID=A0A9E7JWI7_9LILI|nr:hypothetical protein MUK42_36518 [Musa troglodytarum]